MSELSAGAADLLDPRDLVGRWHLARTIEDRRAGERHRLDGVLTIVGTDSPLSWEEALTWHRATGPVPMSRRLRLVREQEGWWVRFEDDGPFHPWTPGTPVVHPCGGDSYVGTVTGDLSGWTVTWEVSGPGKDYTMRSVLLPGPAD